jgi:hypothetical protein
MLAEHGGEDVLDRANDMIPYDGFSNTGCSWHASGPEGRLIFRIDLFFPKLTSNAGICSLTDLPAAHTATPCPSAYPSGAATTGNHPQENDPAAKPMKYTGWNN